jgi:hypothetical protein
METLYIEAAGLECSEERREISGKIVPMGTGEVGNTNMGGVVFEAGSIDVSDISKIKSYVGWEPIIDLKNIINDVYTAYAKEI